MRAISLRILRVAVTLAAFFFACSHGAARQARKAAQRLALTPVSNNHCVESPRSAHELAARRHSCALPSARQEGPSTFRFAPEASRWFDGRDRRRQRRL